MRSLRYLCLLLCLLLPLASTAQNSNKTTADAVKEILSGKRAPLSYKLKELTSEWASMRVGQALNMQDYMQMVSAMFSSGGVYYTRGEILHVGDIQYLVAYTPPSTKPDMAALMAAQRPDPAMFKPTKLTPDTVLTLSLINTVSLSSLSEIHPFDLDAELKRNAEEVNPPKDTKATTTSSNNNLKQLGLAVMMYLQDYDEVFPPLKTPETFRPLLMPYIKNNAVFFIPNTEPKVGYVANASLSYHTQADIAKPAETVMFYEPMMNPEEKGRNVAFADGHAKLVGEEEFQRLLKQSQMKILTRKAEPPPKPQPKPTRKRSKPHKG